VHPGKLAAERNASLRRSAISTFLLLCLMAGLPSPAGSQNILNNGGFETGLMCYNFWTWSYVGYFKGDYRFTLSSDSHSGNYSFQIACIPGGTDCYRAAVYTQEIPAIPNQHYTTSAWVKCPSGGTALLYVNSSAGGVGGQWLACNGIWTSYSMNFQIGSTATTFWVYVYNYGAQTLLVDDMAVTYSDGTAPSRINLHPGIRPVGIAGQNVLVDGSPYLALGFFGVPRSDISQVRATGANTVHGLGNASGADCFNYGSESYLDAIYEAGMNFVPDSSSSSRLDAPGIFPTIVQTFAPHLANIAWFLSDEPDLVEVPVFEYVPPATFVAEGNAARSATSLPLFADMQHAPWSVAADDVPYAPGIDFWMAEPYGPDFSRLQHATSLLTSIAPRPIWLAQDTIDASLIVPKAYWAIVNGATGIFYFTWSAFQQAPDKLSAATQAFSELTTLKGAIFGSQMDILVTPPAGITTMSRFNQGTAYIMAVNPNSQAAQGKFYVQGMAAGQPVQVMFENRTLTAAAGSFTDSFAGVGRHVYAITSPKTTLAASLTNKTGSTAARAWSILVFNAGIAAANNANIANLGFTRTGGTACTPRVAPGTFPLAVGNLVPGATATGNVVADFTGCDSTSKFTVAIALSANSGATSATVSFANQRY